MRADQYVVLKSHIKIQKNSARKKYANTLEYLNLKGTKGNEKIQQTRRLQIVGKTKHQIVGDIFTLT
jgi:hypothetical protein